MDKVTELLLKIQKLNETEMDSVDYILSTTREIMNTMAYYLKEVYADDVVEIIPTKEGKLEVIRLLDLWKDVDKVYDKYVSKPNIDKDIDSSIINNINNEAVSLLQIYLTNVPVTLSQNPEFYTDDGNVLFSFPFESDDKSNKTETAVTSDLEFDAIDKFIDGTTDKLR